MLNTGIKISLVVGALGSLGGETPPADTQAGPAQDVGSPAPFQWGDYDGDGLDDALATQPNGHIALLKNTGDGTFADVTKAAGLDGLSGARFALWQDYDRDGLPDLFIGTQSGPSHLMKNIGALFVDETKQAGIEAIGFDRSAHWVDYDGDGRVDLHLIQSDANTMFHALPDGRFEAIRLPSVAADATDPGVRMGIVDDTANTGIKPAAGLGPVAGTRSPVTPGGARAPVITTGSSTTSALGANQNVLSCAMSLKDANGGSCLEASATATLGMLYPLSTNLFVDDATGNVGVGTTTPGNPLDVAGDARVFGNLAIGAEPPFFPLHVTTQTNGAQFSVFDNAAVAGTRLVAEFAGAFAGPQLRFHGAPGGAFIDIGEDANAGFVVETTDTPRLTVTHAGNVGIGTTTPNSQLEIENPASTASLRLDGLFTAAYLDRATTGQESLVRFQTGGSDDWLIGTDNVPSGSAGDFSIKTAPNAAPEFVVKPGGNVGIGTAAASHRLQVETDAAGFHAAEFTNTNTGGLSSVSFTDSTGGFRTAFGYLNSGHAAPWAGNSFLIANGGSDFAFITNNGERMRLTSGGSLGIGTTTPTQLLTVNGSAGKPGGGSWSVFSDRRLKTNIEGLEGALDTLLALRGVSFEYKDPEAVNELGGERIGFIAQEVETVMPDWVEDTGDYKMLTIRGFEALTVEALRELEEENAELRERVERLESLEAELANLQQSMALLLETR